MENVIRDEFKDGKIWEHDIEYANILIADYIRYLGGNDAMIKDILDIFHRGDIELTKLDGDRIIRMIDDYIDR